MEKVQKLIPDKIKVLGHKVVVTEEVFDLIINTLNIQTETINSLIDYVEETDEHSKAVDAHVNKLQNSVQALAKALKTYSED